MIGNYCEQCLYDKVEITYCSSVKKFLCEECIMLLAENAYNIKAKEDTNVHDHD